MTTTPAVTRMTAIRTPNTAVTGCTVTQFGPLERTTIRRRLHPAVYDTAESLDGMWGFEQEDEPGTPWRAYLTAADALDPTGYRWSFVFDTLDEARQATATWLLDQLVNGAILRDRYDAADRAAAARQARALARSA